MTISEGFGGAVGDTPLIRLRRLSEETGCDILGKAEFMKPGGSVKDRAALAIIQDAEARGRFGRAARWWKALPAIRGSAWLISAMPGVTDVL